MGDPKQPEPGESGLDPRVRPVDLRDYVRFSTERATLVRVLSTEHLAVDLWCLEPRQTTGALHHAEIDVTYTIVGGRSWFVTEAGEVGLDPMGAVLVRAGTVHGIDNRGADPLIVLATSSPPSGDGEDPPVEDLEEAVHRPDPGPGRLRQVVDRVLGDQRRDAR